MKLTTQHISSDSRQSPCIDPSPDAARVPVLVHAHTHTTHISHLTTQYSDELMQLIIVCSAACCGLLPFKCGRCIFLRIFLAASRFALSLFLLFMSVSLPCVRFANIFIALLLRTRFTVSIYPRHLLCEELNNFTVEIPLSFLNR